MTHDHQPSIISLAPYVSWNQICRAMCSLHFVPHSTPSRSMTVVIRCSATSVGLGVVEHDVFQANHECLWSSSLSMSLAMRGSLSMNGSNLPPGAISFWHSLPHVQQPFVKLLLVTAVIRSFFACVRCRSNINAQFTIVPRVFLPFWSHAAVFSLTSEFSGTCRPSSCTLCLCLGRA